MERRPLGQEGDQRAVVQDQLDGPPLHRCDAHSHGSVQGRGGQRPRAGGVHHDTFVRTLNRGVAVAARSHCARGRAGRERSGAQ